MAIDTLTHPSMAVNVSPWMTIAGIGSFEACCRPLSTAPFGAAEAEEMARAIRVLADPVRLRLVSLLAGVDEACVCELVAPLGVSQPTVSHHLKVLHDVGLVDRDQRGRWVYYRLRRAPLGALARALTPEVPATAGSARAVR
jgi:ArsR family transcriptional regulator